MKSLLHKISKTTMNLSDEDASNGQREKLKAVVNGEREKLKAVEAHKMNAQDMEENAKN